MVEPLHPPRAAARIGPNGSGRSGGSHCFRVAVALFLPPRELVVLGQGCALGLSLLARRYSCSHTEAVPVCACLSPCPQRPHPTQLYQHVPDSRWPIVYSPRYNITFLGLEKLHPFDAGKWGKVISFLKGMEAPPPPGTCIRSLQPTCHHHPLLPFPHASFRCSRSSLYPECLAPVLSRGSRQHSPLSSTWPHSTPSLAPVPWGPKPCLCPQRPSSRGAGCRGAREADIWRDALSIPHKVRESWS